MPGSQDAQVDEETLERLDQAFKEFIWNHDKTMSAVWKETKTVRNIIESAVYYWEDKVEGCEASLRYCYDAAAANGGGDCSHEERAIEEAEQQLAEARSAQERLQEAEWLMDRADKDYRYFLETDVWRARSFLQQKAEVVARYRRAGSIGSGSSGAQVAKRTSDGFDRALAKGAEIAAGAAVAGSVLAVLAVREMARRRQGLAASPATGAREVAALLADGQFVTEPLAVRTDHPHRFAVIHAEPAAGLLLASRTIPVDPGNDDDVRALQLIDPESAYRMALVAGSGDESPSRLFGRASDGTWLEVLPDEDDPEAHTYPDSEPPGLPEGDQ